MLSLFFGEYKLSVKSAKGTGQKEVGPIHMQQACSVFLKIITSPVVSKGWFTLPAEAEAQGALRFSVNQKTEGRRNRSQKDQKSFFFF